MSGALSGNSPLVGQLHKHPCDAGKCKTDDDTAHRRHQEGYKGPFETAGFLAYGEKGGGTGPVHQGKQHGTDSGDPGPSIVHKKFL